MSQPLALPSTSDRAVALRGGWTTAATTLLVAGVGFAHGGYFPEPWGWASFACALAAAAVLLARRDVSLTRPALATAALLVALTVWTALSALWSLSVTETALEAQRTAVYAAAVLAALVWARDRPERLVRGVWFGIVLLAGWGLLTRLVPDRWGVIEAVGGYRLSEPIGYWNSLGLLAGMGALLAVGLAARAETRFGRALAAFTVPPLVTTLYFTFSRGAWIAFGCGLVALLALDRRRAQLAAVLAATAPFVAVAVVLASRRHALTTVGSSLAEQAHEGHRLLAVVFVASIACAVAALLLALVEPRLELPAAWARPARAALVVAVLLALVGVSVRWGSPVTIARDGWRSFSAPPPATGPNLNNHLFQFSGSNRTPQWHVAWHAVEQNPGLGVGAGGFESYWNRHRTLPLKVRDAHNLYLETLAELGPLGLVLLLGAIGIPLFAARRSRHRPLTAAAFAAFVAYLVHAIADWDWEIASVTVAAFLCAAALLAEARPARGAAVRGFALTAAFVLALGGAYAIAMRTPINRLNSALDQSRWADAVHDVRDANLLAPWSSEPYLLLGERELNAGATGDAWGHFRTAVVRDPNNWVAWWDLARASIGVEQTHALAAARRLNPLLPKLPPRPTP